MTRKNEKNGPRILPVLVGLGSRVAPGATAEWAARRFLTTRRMPVRPEQRAVLDRARRDRVDVGGRSAVAYVWGEGPTALLVHGWNGHAGQMAPFVQPLLARGFRVVAYDAPAHGASEGRVSHVPSMADALARVAGAYGPVHTAVAHSAGATALALAMRRGLEVGRAAMIAPAPHPAGWSERFAWHVGLRGEVCRRYFRALERIGGMPLGDIRLVVNAPHVRCPVLVLHDAEDRLVDAREVAVAARALPRAEVVETRGLGHARILADLGVVERAVRFVAAPAVPSAPFAVHVGELCA